MSKSGETAGSQTGLQIDRMLPNTKQAGSSPTRQKRSSQSPQEQLGAKRMSSEIEGDSSAVEMPIPSICYSLSDANVGVQGSQNVVQLINHHHHHYKDGSTSKQDYFSDSSKFQSTHSTSVKVLSTPTVCERVLPDRWQMKIMTHCGVDTLQSAVSMLKPCGVQLLEELGPAIRFEFCCFEEHGNCHHEPLVLPTRPAIDLFGEKFENSYEGLLDFPPFLEVETDVQTLFNDIRSKKTLADIRIGRHLLKFAQKQSDSFHALDGRKPDFLGYKNIMDECKEITEMRRKLMKFVNSKIIAWLDCVNKTLLCDCTLKPALFQNQSKKNLFYGCPKYITGEKDHCSYTKDCWISYY